jgi:NitT/TauT family transport system permease protein
MAESTDERAGQRELGEEPLAIEEVELRVQRALERRDLRARISGIAYPLLATLFILVLWEVGVRLFKVPTYLVPAPTQVAVELWEQMPLLIKHGWVTTREVIWGYLLSIVVGIPLALAIFLSPIFARSIYPLLVSSQAMPKTAIAPLFVVWFGFGTLPKVLIAFLIAFFPIVINTVVGLASIEPEKLYLARSMGMSPLATFFKIRLPQALPAIFGGLKIAIALAVVGAVVGEFVGTDSGLGYLLLVANGNLNTPLLFAGLVGLTIIGVATFMLIEVAERLAIPWHMSQGDTGAHESL